MSGKAPVSSVYYVGVSVLENIRAMLNKAGIAYREVHHEPTLTSEDSARARGEDIRIGGKALLLKVNDEFRLFVLSAARQLDSGAIKQRFNAKKTRFASPDELRELTGLVPGSVPPFGKPLLPFDLCIDESILENEKIAFNAGSLTDSVIMTVADYRKIAQPEVFLFSK
jgi:Ala-tRNA(Pro) deacylase